MWSLNVLLLQQLLGEDHKETVAVAEALKKVQEALAEREMSPEEYEEWKRR